MTDALVIADLSGCPRLGFKGRGTLPAMQARGLQLENKPNRAFRQADGSLCMVLAASEVFLLGAPGSDRDVLAELENSWSIENNENTYPMPRRHSHAWFALAGQAAPELLSKLCAIDLRTRAFDDLSIAQTSVARLNSIVVRADHGERQVYHLLADSAASTYMLICLNDAGREFGSDIIDPLKFKSLELKSRLAG